MKIIKKYITKTKIYNRRLVKSNYFISNFHFIEIVQKIIQILSKCKI